MLLRFLRDTAIVAAILFAVGTIVLHGAPGLTGFLTLEQEATVSIARETDADVTRFAFDDVITEGESTAIDVEITNEGSVDVNPVGYRIEVYDENNTLLYTYPGPENLTLSPGEFHSSTIRHTPHEPGTYFVRLTAEIGNDRTSRSEYLFVLEEAEPQPPEPASYTIIRKTINWVEPPAEPQAIREWNVSDPGQVVVEEGGRTSVPIRISSTGNAPLENVRLRVRGPSTLNVSYTPQIHFAVPAGDTVNFLLNVAAPSGTQQDGTVSYQIRSRRLQQQGSIDVTVTPELTRAQLQDRIRELQDLIRRARLEIAAAREDGVATDPANESLRTARQELRTARSAVDAGRLDDGRAAIDRAGDAVDRTFSRLNRARSRSIALEAPLVRPLYLLLVFAVVAAAILVGGYYYIQEQRTKRPKLLRETEEE